GSQFGMGQGLTELTWIVTDWPDGLYASALAVLVTVALPPPQMRAKKLGKPVLCTDTEIWGLLAAHVQDVVTVVAATPAIGLRLATACASTSAKPVIPLYTRLCGPTDV